MEIALFPIPNCVTFPAQVVSLQVFEPRYRQMVEDCLKAERPVAVCGAKRLLEKAKAHNGSTFEPHSVVAYGKVQVIERMEDGRLLIEVEVQDRGRIASFVQTDPYYVANVQPLIDEEAPPSATQAVLRAEISARFEALWNAVRRESDPLPLRLDSLSFSQLSFQILGFLQTDPVLAQIMLEETNPQKRANILLDILCSLENNRAA